MQNDWRLVVSKVRREWFSKLNMGNTCEMSQRLVLKGFCGIETGMGLDL